MGKDKVDEKLRAFASATLTPAQEKFLRKHMKGGGLLDRKKELRAQLTTLHGSVTQKLADAESGISELARLVTNKDQAEAVGALKSTRGSIVGGIGISAKDVKDAVGKLRLADGALDTLLGDIAKTRKEMTHLDEGQLDTREAIRKLRVAAEGRLRDYLRSWYVGYDILRGELQKVSPGSEPEIPPAADLRIAFKTYFAMLPGTPKEPDATVEQARDAFDTLVGKMKQEHDDARKALDLYAGTGFQVDSRVAQLTDALQGKLAVYEDHARKLATWEVDGREAFEGRATTLRKRVEGLGKGGMTTDAIKQEYTGLASALDTLNSDAAKAVREAEASFLRLQQSLRQEFTTLQNRLGALGKQALPDDQRAQVTKFLAATDTSINKLGGANTAGLAAARLMLIEAEEMVTQAENIGTINDEIEDNLERAKAALKPLAKDAAPVHEMAAEKQLAIAEFEKGWQKKAPTDALKEARALLKGAIELETQNTLLVRLRAQADTGIGKLEKKYEEFNALFKEMLKAKNAPKVRDYRGPIRGEIDGVRTWNATKLDPGFYSTILSRIQSLGADLDARMTEMRAALGSTDEQLAQRAQAARELLEKAQKEGASPEDLALLQGTYDQALAAQTVYNQLSADLLNAEGQEQRYIDDRARFLKEGKEWIKQTETARNKAKTGEPFDTFGDEVDRQITRIEATLKAADADKKGPTGTRGLSELKQVQQAVERIAARGSVIPPDKLGDIAAKWSTAASDFLDNSGKLVAAVAEFEKEQKLDATASRALEKVLFDVYGSLAVTRFAEAGRILGPSDPPKGAQERKAGREIALAEVRRIKKAVMDDAVVRACVANPFGVNAFATKTIAQLEQIELDVLRGA